MIAFDLANSIREQIAADIEVEGVGNNEAVVYMPFIYDDGDPCSIYVTRNKSGWMLTDDGDVFKRASELGVNLHRQDRAEKLQSLIDFYGVAESDGALNLRAGDDELANSLFTLTQTCLEASWLAKAPKTRTAGRANFAIQFEKLLVQALPDVKADRNWHDRPHDPKRIYPVDFRLPGKSRQLFLFGVANQAACMRATITCQHYRIAGAEFDAVAIYDHEEQILKRYADQLNEVVDKRFPRIAEAGPITKYLRSKAA